MSETDEDGKGRPLFVVTEDNITIVKKLIVQVERITVKQFSSETGISVASFELILHDRLSMKKRSAK